MQPGISFFILLAGLTNTVWAFIFYRANFAKDQMAGLHVWSAGILAEQFITGTVTSDLAGWHSGLAVQSSAPHFGQAVWC